MHPFITQALYYFIAMLLGVFILYVLMRSFFFQFLKVRASLGRLVLCKIRAVNRDYYAVGRIEEGFLIYKHMKSYKRIAIKDKSAFYKSIGVTWIDLDEEKNAICTINYEAITGFDAKKYNDLYLRALYKPAIVDTKEKLILGAVVIMGIVICIMAWLVWTQSQDISLIKDTVISMSRAGVVTPGA